MCYVLRCVNIFPAKKIGAKPLKYIIYHSLGDRDSLYVT